MSSTYTRNAVYDYVYGKVSTAHSNVYISGMYEPVVPSLPAVFIREIGNFNNPDNVTFSGVQGVWTSTYEVQIQSNDIASPMSEAYGIFDTVKAAFSSLFYVLESVNVIDNGNGTFRMVASFRKVNGSADEIPSA